ncbi:integrase [Nocardioides humi]|uniref:integrase n=1 Tax=Nocardioides humi TaxID=449461 RepID=UPI00112BF8DC|nr:integrase [Nocardioides humi]
MIALAELIRATGIPARSAQTPDTASAAAVGPTLRDVERIAAALDAEIAPGTRRVYAYAWGLWATWCQGRGLCPLPAAPEAVAAYLAERAEAGFCFGTLEMACSAIAYQHRAAELPNPLDDPTLRRVRRGLRRTVGTAPRRRAHPLSLPDVRRLLDVMDPADLAGARDRALLLVGFASALRPSELGALRETQATTGSDGLLLAIPRSKSDPEGHQQIVPVARGRYPDTDPVAALGHWRKVRDRHDPEHPSDPSQLNTMVDGDDRGARPWVHLFPRLHRTRVLIDQPLSGTGVSEMLQRHAPLPVTVSPLRCRRAQTGWTNADAGKGGLAIRYLFGYHWSHGWDDHRASAPRQWPVAA